VMDPNTALRDNRLALLTQMHGLMNQVADIGKLAAYSWHRNSLLNLSYSTEMA